MTSLYRAMPTGTIVRRRLGRWIHPHRTDLFHMNVPERLVAHDERDQRRYLEFVTKLGRSPIRVVWTMHNRRPHRGDVDWGLRLYHAWAAIVDGVIHQSRWGMKLIRGELPFHPRARHVMISHGHFGNLMPSRQSRAALERDFGLHPCSIRFGVLGQPLETKHIEMIANAFHACSSDDVQLLVTAATSRTPLPNDPRIHVVFHDGWRDRAEVTKHVQLCDVIVCAHGGDAYLSSGQVADAIGAGIPMLVGPWGYAREVMGAASWHFDGSESGLTRAFSRITPGDVDTRKQRAAALQSKCTWTSAATRTLAFFREIVAKDGAKNIAPGAGLSGGIEL
jgi:hypothetical protein